MGALRSFRYANITATLALLFSLAGTGTAASLTASHHQSGSRSASALDAAFIPTALGAQATLAGAGGTARSLRLAGYAESPQVTLPDDSTFHSAWMFTFRAQASQVFILTGNIGGASTPGCASGDSTFSQRIMLDGNVLWELDSDGTTTGTQPGFLLTFPDGKHTLSYDFRGDCPGFPAVVSAVQTVLIPFTRP